VSNQWGRDTVTVQSRGGIGAGTVIAILLSLLVGAGGGFGYAWWRNATAVVPVAQSDPTLADPTLADTAVADLNRQLQEANSGLAAQKADASKREAELKASIAGLEDEIATLKSEEPQSAQHDAQLDEALAKVQNLENALKASQATISDLRGQLNAKPGDDVTAGLQKQIEDLTRANAKLGEDFLALQEDSQKAVSAKQKSLDDLQTKVLEPLQKQRDELASSNADLSRKLETLQADSVTLSAALTAAKAELANLKAQNTQGSDSLPPEPTVTTVPEPEKPPAEQRRSTAEVMKALSETPGLENLSDGQRLDLTARLEKGECVTTALQAEFKRVPVLVLSHLLRALPGGC
jgi:septal ring factor EnvC (AmiA/AmiB activator)